MTVHAPRGFKIVVMVTSVLYHTHTCFHAPDCGGAVKISISEHVIERPDTIFYLLFQIISAYNMV